MTVPDHFEDGVAEASPDNRRYRDTGPVECGAAAIFAEHDDEPAELRGTVVSVTRGQYSVEDLKGIITQKDDELSHCYEQLPNLPVDHRRH